MKVGERGSEWLSAGESRDSSGDVRDAEGGKELVYWESLVDAIDSTLWREVGGSLPLRLSAPLPLLLVLVRAELGLARPWPLDSESLALFEASLSATPGKSVKTVSMIKQL